MVIGGLLLRQGDLLWADGSLCWLSHAPFDPGLPLPHGLKMSSTAEPPADVQSLSSMVQADPGRMDSSALGNYSLQIQPVEEFDNRFELFLVSSTRPAAARIAAARHFAAPINWCKGWPPKLFIAPPLTVGEGRRPGNQARRLTQRDVP